MSKRQGWKDLEIYKKTTKYYELVFTTDGVMDDISDWILYFTMKKNVRDTDSEAIIKQTIGSATGCDYAHEDPTQGKTAVELSTIDTDVDAGSYYYDMTVDDADGNRLVVAIGRIRISEPITTREI